MDKYQLLSYYHSALRNAGLYMSISFAALVYSRFYRGENKSNVHNIVMILMSGIFNVVVHYVCKNLENEINEMRKDDKRYYEFIDKWVRVLKIVEYINYTVSLLLLVTLSNEVRSVKL